MPAGAVRRTSVGLSLPAIKRHSDPNRKAGAQV